MRAKRASNTQKRIRSIHDGLDLGFSDYLQDQNVRDRTILNHLDAIEQAKEMLGVEEGMNFSLFQAFGSAHPSPNIYILDFPSDLRASFYAMLGGYYRQGILCLRNWLEMRLLGIYFGRVESDARMFKNWKLGNVEAPIARALIRRLFARADFRSADDRFGLKVRLETLYRDLSAFTHGAGLEKYNLQSDTGNVPRYNRTSFMLWLRLLNRTFAEIVFCLFPAYGKDAVRALDMREITILLAHLPAGYRRELATAF